MSSVIAEFIKQPVIGILHQFVEGRKVWLAVAGAFAAAEERVDAMIVRRRDEAAPRRTLCSRNAVPVILSKLINIRHYKTYSLLENKSE